MTMIALRPLWEQAPLRPSKLNHIATAPAIFATARSASTAMDTALALVVAGAVALAIMVAAVARVVLWWVALIIRITALFEALRLAVFAGTVVGAVLLMTHGV